MVNINDIFKGFNTPKANLGYMIPYENRFEKYREQVKVFCELGVSHGASLIAWKKYFPNAKIVGIDHDEITTYGFEDFARKHLEDKEIEDISFEFGDAMDRVFLESVAKKYGGFDIVLDDCSHKGIQMQISFEVLWKYTKYLYAVEDLQTQFNGNPVYIEDGNFIDYVQTLVKEGGITRSDVENKTTFTSKKEGISHIGFENYIVFMEKESK